MSWRDTTDDPSANPRHPECEDRPRPPMRLQTALKTPWTLIDRDGASGGILARIVTDREMGHVAIFEHPETARVVVETMNRAESLEQERAELERELGEMRGMLGAKQATVEDQQRQLMMATRDLAAIRSERDLVETQKSALSKRAIEAEEELDEMRAKLKEFQKRETLRYSDWVHERVSDCTPAETRAQLAAMEREGPLERRLLKKLAAAYAQQCTPAERAVLDAEAALTTESLQSFGNGGTPWQRFARAALARRGEKP